MTTEKPGAKSTAKKSVENKDKAIVDATKNVQSAVEQSNGREKNSFKQALSGMQERFGELREISNESVAVLKESGSAAVDGVAELGKETSEYAKSTWGMTNETAKSVFQAKNLEQVTQIEVNFVTGRINETAAYVKRVADMSAQSGLAVFLPWAKALSRVAIRADQMRYAKR